MRYLFYFLLIVLCISSCKVYQYPIQGNYANKTKINIIGNYTNIEKKILIDNLYKQIDDSLTYTKIKKNWLRFWPHFVKVYHNFDSNSISRTIDFFKAAYVANGYFRGGKTTYNISGETRAKTIEFNAFPFENHKIKTVTYSFTDTVIQQIAEHIKDSTFLKKNDLYSQDLLDAERRRIAAKLRNEGYLYFNKEDIKVITDTTNLALIKIASDPIEEQQLLEDAAAFNQHPTSDITIAFKDGLENYKLKKYTIGNIIIQPDNIDEDQKPTNEKLINNDKVILQYFKHIFNDKLFDNKIFLKKGDLFKQENLDKTFASLNYLKAWQQVVINPIEKTNKNDTIDFKISMLPYIKNLREYKLEGSYNLNNSTNSFLKSLYGINFSYNLKNRNFRKQAIQSLTSAILSTEFGSNDSGVINLINTVQLGLNYSLVFPKILFPKSWNYNKNLIQPSSFLNANTNFSKRLFYFDLFEAGIAYGNQFMYKNKWNTQLSINVEEKIANLLPKLKDLIILYPSLKEIYRDGLVISPFKGITNKQKVIKENIIAQTNVTTFVNYSLEWASGIPGFNKNNIYKFLKADYDRRYFFKNQKNTVAIRFYAGMGINLNKENTTLPFFRQFVAGGPNSMRGWALRNLSSYSTRTNIPNNSDYYGDIQAETNVEYRFKYGNFMNHPLLGALFLDMGNIWNFKANVNTLVPYNLSAAQRLYNDIAMAAGTSFRYDLNYFIIRLDLGTKIKAPLDINNNGGWFNKYNFSLKNAVKLQVGIGYPF